MDKKFFGEDSDFFSGTLEEDICFAAEHTLLT